MSQSSDNEPDVTVTFMATAREPDPMEILRSLDAKISPALTRPGPLRITARDCVICGTLNPGTDCICHMITFGSQEYLARLDKLHGKTR